MKDNKKLKEEIMARPNLSEKLKARPELFTSRRASFRGRRGRNTFFRGKGSSRIMNTNYPDMNYDAKRIKLDEKDEFPELRRAESYKAILQIKDKRDYTCIVKQYMNNFLKLSNKLNTCPIKYMPDGELEYISYPYEKYNMMVALPGCNSQLVKATYDYGLLYCVYTTDGSELQHIEKLYGIVKNYLGITRAEMVYVRIYSAIGEVTHDEIIQATRIIKIGITQQFIIPKEEQVQVQPELLFAELPHLMTKKRAWSFKLIVEAIKKVQKSKIPVWINDCSQNTLIMTVSRNYGENALQALEQVKMSIIKPSVYSCQVIPTKFMSEEGSRKLCKLFSEEIEHRCTQCGRKAIIVPIIDEELFKEDGPSSSLAEDKEEDN